MFDIGWSELLLIGIVALIAIGPKELPTVLRTVGQWMGKLRRMATEFQNQFHEAMREAEMADLKKQVEDMTSQAQGYANFDPVGDVRREFESAQKDIDRAIAGQPASSTAGALPESGPAESVKAESAPALAEAAALPAPPVADAATASAGTPATDSPPARDAEAKPA
jgi:sec-independent protein translocase protein TatB